MVTVNRKIVDNFVTNSPAGRGDKCHHCHHEKMAPRAIFSWWLVTLDNTVVSPPKIVTNRMSLV